MKTYIYRGGFPIVEKSGVGKAIEHQEKMVIVIYFVQLRIAKVNRETR